MTNAQASSHGSSNIRSNLCGINFSCNDGAHDQGQCIEKTRLSLPKKPSGCEIEPLDLAKVATITSAQGMFNNKHIDLVKGPVTTAPVVMAMTVESP